MKEEIAFSEGFAAWDSALSCYYEAKKICRAEGRYTPTEILDSYEELLSQMLPEVKRFLKELLPVMFSLNPWTITIQKEILQIQPAPGGKYHLTIKSLTQKQIDASTKIIDGRPQFDPDETGAIYGIKGYYFESVEEYFVVQRTGIYFLQDQFPTAEKEYAIANGALSHMIALSNDDPAADPEIQQKGNPRRGIPGIEGLTLHPKAKPVLPEGQGLNSIFIVTNQIPQEIASNEAALEAWRRANRENALNPSRDHLFQYFCHLYNQGKPLVITLTEFIILCGLDPSNRNAAKWKLIKALFDLRMIAISVQLEDGYTRIYNVFRYVDIPPIGSTKEGEYRADFDDYAKILLTLEAQKNGKEKVPAAYFRIDDRHRTANAIASAFLQDESRNATRPNPTTRNAQALMNEVYPRTNPHYSRTQTQIKPLFEDLRYLKDLGVFTDFCFLMGKRSFTLDRAAERLKKWADFEGVYIEAKTTNPERYKIKKDRRETHLKKAEEKKGNSR